MLYKDNSEMHLQYDFTKRMYELYSFLTDDESKELFWARLRYDAEPSLENMQRLVLASSTFTEEKKAERRLWRDKLNEIYISGKKIVFYGAGTVGKDYADMFAYSGLDFSCFCDYYKHGHTYCGHSVIPPQELFEEMDDYYVIITAGPETSRQVMELLKKNGFREDHILDFMAPIFERREGVIQYFEFAKMFPLNSAFVDAGCFDATDTIAFSEVFRGKYSNIIALEPDPKNYRVCEERIKEAGLNNVELLQVGLSDSLGNASFVADASGGSYMLSEAKMYGRAQPSFETRMTDVSEIQINTSPLDSITPKTRIGMIKMDIEGAEWKALHGAEKTIMRDKPVLALSVYHRRGDLLVIMDYLHTLVPDYFFWIRHYGSYSDDTVLYAGLSM